MPADQSTARSGSRLRGCLLAGCLGLVVLTVAPPVVLWSLTRGWDEPPGPPRHLAREHVLQPLGPATSGRVVLDVAMSDVSIEVGEPGSQLRVEADWDPKRFRFSEGLERDDEGWVYRVELRSRGLRAWTPVYVDHHGPELRLRLPPDQPMAVEGEIGMGRSVIDLGGAAIGRIELELGTGEHTLTFSRPLRAALELLRLDSSMGELEVEQVGNASPRQLSIAHRMGELRLDLGGPWRNDGEVDLQLSMGHCEVRLPERDEAGALVEESRMTMGSRRIEDQAESEIPPGLPRLRIRARGGMGELEIR